MATKCFTMDFSNIAKEITLRKDFDYLQFQNYFEMKAHYSFDELFEIVTKQPIDINTLPEDFLYCEIGNVTKEGDLDPVALNFEERTLLDDSYYKKIEKGDIISVNSGDILLSKVRPNLKKYVKITDESKELFFTSAFIKIRAKKADAIFYYCLRNIFYNSIVAISRQGKGYPTLNEKDLKFLKFDKATIDRLLSQKVYIEKSIYEIEQQIKYLRGTKKSDKDIINEVFGREFGFDYNTFEKLKAHKKYSLQFDCFANNIDLRYSAKFHREAGKFVMEQLKVITDKKIKHFILEPIVLGTSVSPSDYDENGEYFYISMANIKNWKFEDDEAKNISNLYSKRNMIKTVAKNDILLARSGEGTIGKVALINDDDINGIFADFTMRIRLTRYNPLFAYYYFRTSYFQYLVEVYKKGLGNNTNIFPSIIQEFPLIDIALSEQDRIVEEIKQEIDGQNEITRQIAELRNQIDEIIEQVINKT